LNEAGGPKMQSQTNQAKLYEFTSTNGVTIHILDTPGLADTHSFSQDESHKVSIAQVIHENIPTVNAVLILTNGIIPCLGAATDYALSTLSSMFPRSLANNISIVFTNVTGPLSWNFDMGMLPHILHKSHNWLLNNPIATRNKFFEISDRGLTSLQLLSELEQSVEEGHEKMLKVLVKIFSWLDYLDPQSPKDIISLHDQSLAIDFSISNALARMSQLAEKNIHLNKILKAAEGTQLVCYTTSTFCLLTHLSDVRP
jgi:hypothetical protein